MLEQMRVEIRPGQVGEARRGRPGRCAPVWIDALQLVDEIDVASLLWSRGSDAAARLLALTECGWSVEDTKRVGVMCDALEAWVAQIRELLDPPARWSLPNPCPACGVRTVYRIKDGEHLRMAALQVGAEGCECQSCRTVWTPDRFVWLARLLGYEMPAGVLE